MTGWDIDAEQVWGRYTASSAGLEDFRQHTRQYSERYDEVGEVVGALEVGGERLTGDALAFALTVFSRYAGRRIDYIEHRQELCWGALVEATNAYAAGDLDMAAEAQERARPVVPGPTDDYGPQ
ncbi:DUF6507 family protein [Streptomyces bohaiensis]|uniref:Uncharacterized protein n=1 Tax=Streptomyces bohaiensis TaxID=1431344 RepID=A0ABX1CDH4_9ACTN|nr:DUF6507 family protein [Streptomyces bohaiensis]NJQ17136.1 hypothetical protein [Streptomyces bohaiensis]